MFDDWLVFASVMAAHSISLEIFDDGTRFLVVIAGDFCNGDPRMDHDIVPGVQVVEKFGGYLPLRPGGIDNGHSVADVQDFRWQSYTHMVPIPFQTIFNIFLSSHIAGKKSSYFIMLKIFMQELLAGRNSILDIE